jgi:hypothetical protein
VAHLVEALHLIEEVAPACLVVGTAGAVRGRTVGHEDDGARLLEAERGVERFLGQGDAVRLIAPIHSSGARLLRSLASTSRAARQARQGRVRDPGRPCPDRLCEGAMDVAVAARAVTSAPRRPGHVPVDGGSVPA